MKERKRKGLEEDGMGWDGTGSDWEEERMTTHKG